ncbi:MAG TPA: hypothetical protein VF166_05680 [Gemmatimonadaceae bacterium]
MWIRRIAGGVAAIAALTGLSYLTYVAITYRRYGRAAVHTTDGQHDTLLDRFMPAPEVAERHETRVAAPAELTFEAARALDLQRSALVRAIFAGRELLMRAPPAPAARPRAFVDEVLALGWGILAEVPGREIIFGAVTQPWKGDVHFRAIPPDRFAAFHEPGYAKIVWTLTAEPLGPDTSTFRTETRVTTTDPDSRERFRRYWSVMSPGILLIRYATLPQVRREAERRARARERAEANQWSGSPNRPSAGR